MLSAKDQFANGPVMLILELQICDRDLQKNTQKSIMYEKFSLAPIFMQVSNYLITKFGYYKLQNEMITPSKVRDEHDVAHFQTMVLFQELTN